MSKHTPHDHDHDTTLLDEGFDHTGFDCRVYTSRDEGECRDCGDEVTEGEHGPGLCTLILDGFNRELVPEWVYFDSSLTFVPKV